jgi:formyl-CoA transferase/succinyl-CoA--D-citramalate CoA-transferase
VIIAANADNVFRRLCEAMSQSELATDPRFATHQARGENQEEIDAIVAQWTAQRPNQEVVRLMDEAGVPAGPIYTGREMIADPHFQARKMIQPMPIEEGVEFPMTGIVPLLSSTPGEVRWPGPIAPGSHNRDVLSDVLGMASEQIDDLAARGII